MVKIYKPKRYFNIFIIQIPLHDSCAKHFRLLHRLRSKKKKSGSVIISIVDLHSFLGTSHDSQRHTSYKYGIYCLLVFTVSTQFAKNTNFILKSAGKDKRPFISAFVNHIYHRQQYKIFCQFPILHRMPYDLDHFPAPKETCFFNSLLSTISPRNGFMRN